MTSLTPLELAIMKSLWTRRRARVRDVHSDLLPQRKLAYTTVLTVLDRLFHKGIVTRTKESRAHVYVAAVSEERARADAVAGVVGDYFGGSRRALGAFLAGTRSREDAQPAAPPWPDEPTPPEASPPDGLAERVRPPEPPREAPDGHPIDEALL